MKRSGNPAKQGILDGLSTLKKVQANLLVELDIASKVTSDSSDAEVDADMEMLSKLPAASLLGMTTYLIWRGEHELEAFGKSKVRSTGT